MNDKWMPIVNNSISKISPLSLLHIRQNVAITIRNIIGIRYVVPASFMKIASVVFVFSSRFVLLLSFRLFFIVSIVSALYTF